MIRRSASSLSMNMSGADMQEVMQQRKLKEQEKGEVLATRVAEFANQPNAAVLDLTNLNLTDIPKEVMAAKAPNLKTLNVADNNIKKLGSSTFKLMPNVEHLDLGGNAFSSFPKVVLNLTNLMTLRIHKNTLKTLPSEMKGLTKLTELNAHNNAITKFPKHLNHMRSLRTLVLSCNAIGGVVDVSGMTELERLSLADCKLTGISPLTPNTKLKSLNLGRNAFTTFPDIPATCAELTELDFGDNQFQNIAAEAFIGLVAVEEFNLSMNKLKTLPVSIGKMTRLKKLRVTDNELESIPNDLLGCKKLTELDVRNNKLESLPRDLHTLKKLKRLFVANNKLRRLPKGLVECKIERALVSKNPLDESHAETLKVLLAMEKGCSQWAFDWQSSGLDETVVEVGGEVIKRRTVKQHTFFETADGELLHPHSVRTMEASTKCQNLDRQKLADLEQPVAAPVAPAKGDRRTKRISVDWSKPTHLKGN